MAKGNLFQGQARGKVGDTVFSVLNGQQISRVRNRSPKNPQTSAQMYQRAIMATVMRAYSAGKMIFDHSFEGKSVGAMSMARFMKLNADKLRSVITGDVTNNRGEAAAAGRVVGPGVETPTPWQYIVAEGSLPQVVVKDNGAWTFPAPLTSEKIGEYCTRMGWESDELFTFVGFCCADGSNPSDIIFTTVGEDSAYSQMTKGGFYFLRLKIKASALTSTTAINAATPITDIFDVDEVYNCALDASVQGLTAILVNPTAYNGIKYDSVIHSKDNQKLRSNCVLELAGSSAEYGIATPYITEAWGGRGSSLGQSSLILEGGNF